MKFQELVDECQKLKLEELEKQRKKDYKMKILV